jgi:hypothetical protein
VALLVGSNTSPGSNVAIRVDDTPAFTGNEKAPFIGVNAQKVIDALKAGTRVTTRYVKWPQNTNVDASFELYGFDEAYDYVNWALKQIK